jgi:hypothetical protein
MAGRQAETEPAGRRAGHPGDEHVRISDFHYGPQSRNRLDAVIDPTVIGARAALESTYYAFNNRDIDVMRAVWSADPLVQLNRPRGGSVRGPRAVSAEYEEIFARSTRQDLRFDDIAEYPGPGHILFAGRETCDYLTPDGDGRRILFRATRYFRFSAETARWEQFHYHGSIDPPARPGSPASA